MKAIEFIAPVESMRGNLSGRQDLVYAENDNKAYEAPADQRNYARNYSPRFIGAKRSADGRKYFAVKTKTATTITAASKRAMAVLGGVGAITAAILRSETYKAACKAQMVVENEQGYNWKSLRQFLDAKIRPVLTAKGATVVIAPVGGVFNNPWVDGGTGINLQIPETTLVRFWLELANEPVLFYVDGLKGVAHSNEYFEAVIASHHNVLGLAKKSADGADFVAIGDQFLCFRADDTIYSPIMTEYCTANDGQFYLSSTHGEVTGG